MASGSGAPAERTLKPLDDVQNKGLRIVLGAYKRTPRALLATEAEVEPTATYAETVALEHALKTESDDVTRHISRTLDDVWNASGAQAQRRLIGPRPPSAMEKAITRARTVRERGEEIQRTRAAQEGARRTAARARGTGRGRERFLEPRQGRHRHKWKPVSQIRTALEEEWRLRWIEKRAAARTAVAWRNAWGSQPLRLYRGLRKAESTALFLMRTEVIGLKDWLTRVGVPNVIPRCDCGYPAQTVRHVLLQCPLHNREDMLREARTQELDELLSREKSARAAARWFVRSGILEQFRVANQIAGDNRSEYQALRLLGEGRQ